MNYKILDNEFQFFTFGKAKVKYTNTFEKYIYILIGRKLSSKAIKSKLL